MSPSPPPGPQRNRSWAEWLALQPVSVQRSFYQELTPEEKRHLQYSWAFHGRPSQQIPPGDWLTWLVLAGRGAGKTRTGAQTVIEWKKQGYQYINLAGRTIADVRDVMIFGKSGIIPNCPPELKPEYVTSKRQLIWPDKSITQCFTSEEPDKGQGPQSEKLWADEFTLFKYGGQLYIELEFGLRLGDKPQALLTTTGRRTKQLVKIMDRYKNGDPTVRVTRGRTLDNRANLNKDRLQELINQYAGTALGAVYLDGEMALEKSGFLFFQDQINEDRWTNEAMPKIRLGTAKMPGTAMGVDPAVTSGARSDLQGIVVAGIGAADDDIYVMADKSARLTPGDTCKTVVGAYKDFGVDVVVVETNRGGEWIIEGLIAEAESQDMRVNIIDSKHLEPEYKLERGWMNIKPINSQVGKSYRIEPVSQKYEKHRAHHVGFLLELEEEICGWDPETPGRSPNRMDALGFAAGELYPNVIEPPEFWCG